MPVGRLSLEQALQYRWLPVKEMYQTVYETSLLQEGLERGVNFTPVGGIRSASYGDPALKMVPAVYYRRPDLSFVRVLDWGRGHRFGIVLGKKRGDVGDGLCPRGAAAAAVPLGKAVRPEAGSGGRIKKKENPLRRIRASSPEGRALLQLTGNC